MRKLLLCLAIIAIFAPISMAQSIKLDNVTGYGRNKQEALKDAFTYAVQLAVGTLISSEIYIVNGRLIDEKVIAHSEGFIEKHEEIMPFNGESIVISASVKTKYLGEELTLYTTSKVDDEGVTETRFDGSSIVAKADTVYETQKNRANMLKTEGDKLFYELQKTRNIHVASSSEPKADDKRQIFEFEITTNQQINEIRYASVIGRFDRLFTGAGANAQKWSAGGTIPPNTIVLWNIDNSATAYTFESDAFKALHGLFYKFQVLNSSAQIVEISFLDEKRKTVGNYRFALRSEYFTDIGQGSPDSFTIRNSISYAKTTNTVRIDRERLSQTKDLVSGYSTKDLGKQIQSKTDTMRYKDKFGNRGYNLFAFKAGYLSIVNGLAVDRTAGGGAEFSKFYQNFPYVGFGIDASYSLNIESSKNNVYKERKDNITVIDAGIKGIIRYPVYLLELYAAGGFSYAIIDAEIGNSKYSDSFANATAETGINIFLGESMFIGLGYKYYLPFHDDYTFMDKIEGRIGIGF